MPPPGICALASGDQINVTATSKPNSNTKICGVQTWRWLVPAVREIRGGAIAFRSSRSATDAATTLITELPTSKFPNRRHQASEPENPPCVIAVMLRALFELPAD